jgi:hypothetical protein
VRTIRSTKTALRAARRPRNRGSGNPSLR